MLSVCASSQGVDRSAVPRLEGQPFVHTLAQHLGLAHRLCRCAMEDDRPAKAPLEDERQAGDMADPAPILSYRLRDELSAFHSKRALEHTCGIDVGVPDHGRDDVVGY